MLFNHCDLLPAKKKVIQFMFKKLLAIIVLICLTTQSYAINVAYISDVAGNWPGQVGNQNTLDDVFGSGNWDNLSYTSPAVTSGTLLTPGNYDFIFFEGSKIGTSYTAFSNYMNANNTNLETWVSQGGNLLLNAARDIGGQPALALPFGGVLTADGNLVDAVPADPSHPLFNGIADTHFIGSPMGYSSIQGANYTPLLLNTNILPDALLSETFQGLGHVTAAGLTLPWFNNGTPSWTPNTTPLHANIIYQAAFGTPIPEPITLATTAIACIAIGTRLKRRNTKA